MSTLTVVGIYVAIRNRIRLWIDEFIRSNTTMYDLAPFNHAVGVMSKWKYRPTNKPKNVLNPHFVDHDIRSSAELCMDTIGKRWHDECGLERYTIQKGKADELGTSELFDPVDLPYKTDPCPEKPWYKLVDVDYYIDMAKFISGGRALTRPVPTGPMLLYGFNPTSIAEDSSPTMTYSIRGKSINYSANGGFHATHGMWDYGDDYCQVRDPHWLFWKWFCPVTWCRVKRITFPHHRTLTLIVPECRLPWYSWLCRIQREGSALHQYDFTVQCRPRTLLEVIKGVASSALPEKWSAFWFFAKDTKMVSFRDELSIAAPQTCKMSDLSAAVECYRSIGGDKLSLHNATGLTSEPRAFALQRFASALAHFEGTIPQIQLGDMVPVETVSQTPMPVSNTNQQTDAINAAPLAFDASSAARSSESAGSSVKLNIKRRASPSSGSGDSKAKLNIKRRATNTPTGTRSGSATPPNTPASGESATRAFLKLPEAIRAQANVALDRVRTLAGLSAGDSDYSLDTVTVVPNDDAPRSLDKIDSAKPSPCLCAGCSGGGDKSTTEGLAIVYEPSGRTIPCLKLGVTPVDIDPILGEANEIRAAHRDDEAAKQAYAGRISKMQEKANGSVDGDYIDEFVDGFIYEIESRGLLAVDPLTDEQAVARSPAKNRSAMEEGLKTLMGPHCRKTKQFVKGETIDATGVIAQTKDPRMISPLDPAVQARFYKYIYPLQDKLHDAPWFAFGRPPVRVADRICELSLNLASDEEVVVTDYSRYDGTHTKQITTVAKGLYRRAFCARGGPQSKELESLLAYSRNLTSQISRLLGRDVDSGNSMNSGQPDTCYRNSLLSCFMFYTAIGPSCFDRCILGGDDGVSRVRRVDIPRIEEAARKCGFVLKLKVVPRGQPIHFLGRYFEWGGRNSVPDPGRTVRKLHIVSQANLDPKFAPAAFIEKANSLLETDPDFPTVSQYLRSRKAIVRQQHPFAPSLPTSLKDRDWKKICQVPGGNYPCAVTQELRELVERHVVPNGDLLELRDHTE